MSFLYKVTEEQNVNQKMWEDQLKSSHFVSPFQTPQYYQFLKTTPGCNALVYSLIVSDKLKATVVITIFKESGLKAVFSKRGVIFGGPLLADDIASEELFYFLKKVSEKLKGKAIYVETRNFFDFSAYKNAFEQAGWNYEPYLNFQLDLKGLSNENLLSKFKYNRRREIKQSVTNGAVYGQCVHEKEIKDIYKILSNLYKTRVKLPLPPLGYFLGLYKHNLIKAFVVKHNDKVIGGSFCPFLPGKTIYTYYYCGLRDYHKRIFPTHLAVLAAMEYAIDSKIPVLDFMGAGKPDVEYGVRKYKSEFGGAQVEQGRFIKILNPFMYNLGKLGLRILTKIG